MIANRMSVNQAKSHILDVERFEINIRGLHGNKRIPVKERNMASDKEMKVRDWIRLTFGDRGLQVDVLLGNNRVARQAMTLEKVRGSYSRFLLSTAAKLRQARGEIASQTQRLSEVQQVNRKLKDELRRIRRRLDDVARNLTTSREAGITMGEREAAIGALSLIHI